MEPCFNASYARDNLSAPPSTGDLFNHTMPPQTRGAHRSKLLSFPKKQPILKLIFRDARPLPLFFGERVDRASKY